MSTQEPVAPPRLPTDPLSELPGIGAVTHESLADDGYDTVVDVFDTDPETLADYSRSRVTTTEVRRALLGYANGVGDYIRALAFTTGGEPTAANEYQFIDEYRILAVWRSDSSEDTDRLLPDLSTGEMVAPTGTKQEEGNFIEAGVSGAYTPLFDAELYDVMCEMGDPLVHPEQHYPCYVSVDGHHAMLAPRIRKEDVLSH